MVLATVGIHGQNIPFDDMLQTLKVHYTHDSRYTKKHNIISKQNNEMPFLGSRLGLRFASVIRLAFHLHLH
jgi:hypothetical protein